jgi:hypothetical protein
MVNKSKNLTGKIFTNLKVLEHNKLGTCLCKCKCGKILNVETYRLKTKHIKSCGCLKKRHGFWNTNYSKGKMKFYKMWQSLKARCDNPNLPYYKNYGGRGIIYDSKWNDFLEFKKDMYLKYLVATIVKKMKNATIERIDVNGNYNKENCTFIERVDQLKNTRSVRSFIAISPEGKEFFVKNVNEFAKKYGLNTRSHIYECLDGKAKKHKGWKFRIN